MSRITGLSGALFMKSGWSQTPTGSIMGVRNYTINFASESPDTTGYDSAGWVQRVAGLRDWNGSFQTSFDDNATSGTPVVINLFEQESTAKFQLDSARAITGNIIVTGFSLNNSVEGAPEITVQFVGCKAPTTVPTE